MEKLKNLFQNHIFLAIGWFVFLSALFGPTQKHIMTPLAQNMFPLESLTESKNDHEIFGFAPHWTLDNLDSVDFNTLTTLAYFDVKVDAEGNIIKDDAGYQSFLGSKATALFRKAHAHGTRVVLTMTQMDNATIEALMDNPEGQKRLIEESVSLVERRGIDGINVDFEYTGNPGDAYRSKFTKFIKDLTEEMHSRVPGSQITVSVYASSVIEPKIADIGGVSQYADGIFMMAYDYATASSDVAMPTAPLYGHKQGQYWYDVSTAVEDFLKHMPANKLILGTPWYGLNFPVPTPAVKAETSWGNGLLQTYGAVEELVNADNKNIENFKTGWDEHGQVGWKAYQNPGSSSWRMVFMDDPRSLGAKYDFAKEKGLLGVGMWALGFENDQKEMWDVLKEKFGTKLANITISNKKINENI